MLLTNLGGDVRVVYDGASAPDLSQTFERRSHWLRARGVINVTQVREIIASRDA